MKIKVDFQKACTEPTPPAEDFEKWIRSAITAVKQADKQVEVNVRVVGEQEMSRLNYTFRDKTGTTNVLSFQANLPREIELHLLGDIAICASEVMKEASELGTPEKSHWAHLTVHGVLHLIGYDHENEMETNRMQSLETSILAGLGIPCRYTPKKVLE